MTVATGLLVVALAGCTGRGGGYLAPAAPLFTGEASFGFSFSCERSSNSVSPNPPAGRLRIQLSYTDHGANPLGSGFSVHGTVDQIDPVVESMICIGQNPPPTPNELIFLGTYRAPSPAPAGFASVVPGQGDGHHAVVPLRGHRQRQRPESWAVEGRLPSRSGSPSATVVSSELDPATVFYARAGLLEGGNLTVD